jgi:hypothetical protein
MSFKRDINGNVASAFPGAYVFTGNFSGGAGAIVVPIYKSETVNSNPDYEFYSDKEKYVYVLPGYKLIVYEDNYSGLQYTVDNTYGTEILFQKSAIPNIISSYALFFKDTQI